MHLVDPWANLSRWREHPIEVTVLSTGLILLALLLPPVPCGPVIIMVSAAAVVFGARIPAMVYFRLMALPLSFLILGSVALIFSVDIDDAGRFSVAATREGAITAGLVFLRSLAAVSAMILLALTIPMQELFSLMRRLHAPAVLIELMSLVYRLLFVFDRTLSAMIRAQGCRLGYRNLRTSYRSLGAALAALFIRVVDRARRLERGLAARGYQGQLRVLSCRHTVSPSAMLGVCVTHLCIVSVWILWSIWQGGFEWPI